MNAHDPVQTLMQNLAEQNRSYEGLLEDMKRQLQAINQNDDELLMQAIKDKNLKIQTLHRLEQEARSGAAALTPEQKNSLGDQSGPLRETMVQALERLIQSEEDCQTAITAKRAELEEQLLEFKKKKSLFKGYGEPPSRGGGFSGDA